MNVFHVTQWKMTAVQSKNKHSDPIFVLPFYNVPCMAINIVQSLKKIWTVHPFRRNCLKAPPCAVVCPITDCRRVRWRQGSGLTTCPRAFADHGNQTPQRCCMHPLVQMRTRIWPWHILNQLQTSLSNWGSGFNTSRRPPQFHRLHNYVWLGTLVTAISLGLVAPHLSQPLTSKHFETLNRFFILKETIFKYWWQSYFAMYISLEGPL